MKAHSSLKLLLFSLCLMPLAVFSADRSHGAGGGHHASMGPGIHRDVHPVRWPPYRRPVNPVSIRPLQNGGVMATMRNGCYVILNHYGRVVKESSCSKAELVIATRAARDYLSRRRW
jgi:hypothetical protein